MPTLHFDKGDVLAAALGPDGSGVLELTDDAARKLAHVVRRYEERRAPAENREETRP